MLTSDGAHLLWQIAAGQSQDSLAGGAIEVANGTERALSQLDAEPVVEGKALTVVATFGETDANFEWSERRVLSAAGVVIDVDATDQGRKAPGSVWVIEAEIELVA